MRKKSTKSTLSFPERFGIDKKVQFAAALVTIFGGVLAFKSCFFHSSPSPHQLTVYVHDSRSRQHYVPGLKATLGTHFRNRPDKVEIPETGRVNFGEIPSDLIGEKIGFWVESSDYELSKPDSQYVNSGTPIYLEIRKKRELGRIKGRITEIGGEKFIAGAKVYIGLDTLTLSDKNGVFEIELPESMKSKDAESPYSLKIVKEGYKAKSMDYFPAAKAEDIWLEPNL